MFDNVGDDIRAYVPSNSIAVGITAVVKRRSDSSEMFARPALDRDPGAPFACPTAPRS